MRIAQRHQAHADRSTVGLGRSIGLVLAAIALVVATVYGFLQSRDATESRRIADDQAAQIDLLQVRVQLGWLHFDLMTDALSGAFTREPVRPMIDEFITERNHLLSEVRGLARLGGDVGPMAESLLEIHTAADADISRWPIDANVLDALHYDSMPFEFAGRQTDRLGAHLDGVSVSMIPRLVLGDAVSIALQGGDGNTPGWAADYVEQTASFAIEAPGWFGPARQSPMTNHVLTGPGGPDGSYRDIPMMAAAAESVEGSIRRAWDYDQWIIAGDLDSPAPLTIAELSADVGEISAAFEAGFLAGMAEEREAILRDAPGESAATIWFIVALTALGALVLGLTGVMVRQWRRQRSLTQAAYVDGLTGAFNRRFLSEEIDGWCRRGAGHVAIAMVDLDRFKLVNDTWGHAVGDTVLTEAARRLSLTAARLRPDDADAASAVVRIGGDEFLMALVGSQPFDTSAIEAAILDIAGPVEVTGGDAVPLALSVGVASATTPSQLDDLMRAADLAVYADKGTKRDTVHPPSPTRSSAITERS